MKTRLLKIGIILIVSGLIVFGTAVSIIELEKSSIGSNEMRPIPNLAFYNMSTILVGIPTSFVGMGVAIMWAKTLKSK